MSGNPITYVKFAPSPTIRMVDPHYGMRPANASPRPRKTPEPASPSPRQDTPTEREVWNEELSVTMAGIRQRGISHHRIQREQVVHHYKSIGKEPPAVPAPKPITLPPSIKAAQKMITEIGNQTQVHRPVPRAPAASCLSLVDLLLEDSEPIEERPKSAPAASKMKRSASIRGDALTGLKSVSLSTGQYKMIECVVNEEEGEINYLIENGMTREQVAKNREVSIEDVTITSSEKILSDMRRTYIDATTKERYACLFLMDL